MGAPYFKLSYIGIGVGTRDSDEEMIIHGCVEAEETERLMAFDTFCDVPKNNQGHPGAGKRSARNSPGVLLVSGSDQVLGGGEERRESRRDEHSSGPEHATPRETGDRRSGQTGKRRRQARSKSLGVWSDRQEQIRNGRNEGIAADQEAEWMNVGTEVNTEGVLDGRRFRVRARGAGMFGYSGYGLETRRSGPELGCSAAEAGGWYQATVGRMGFGHHWDEVRREGLQASHQGTSGVTWVGSGVGPGVGEGKPTDGVSMVGNRPSSQVALEKIDLGLVEVDEN
ncbi:hypothetical protein BKA70DRAFT_1235753 [Coprinopsis sp. MPI-PUGE-AT-0042]|nr:hypothetical protein BKA70DRAFT_1235753 [Coprinopsis sp. MPI-PUGE-AT-0042]